MTTAKLSPQHDIKQRLLDACKGHPAAKIPWPHRLLHEAAAHIAEVEGERDSLEKKADQAEGYYTRRIQELEASLVRVRSDRDAFLTRAESAEEDWQAAEVALRSRDEAVRELLKAVERLPATGACWELGCGCVSSTVRAAAERLEKIVGQEGKR